MKKVTSFFIKNTEYDIENVVNVEAINNSFTNDVYHIITNNGNEYKVRFAATNQYINRELESRIEHKLFNDDILFYDDNGNYIKKWYKGRILEKNDLNNDVLEKINDFCNKIHSLKFDDIKIENPVFVLNNHEVRKELIKPLLAYKKIINEDVKSNLSVISHNDVSCNNIILSSNDIVIIDYEWMTWNHPYWDISNLIKDLELSIDEVEDYEIFNNFNIDVLIKIIYATHFYTYFWTLKMEETKMIIEYRERIIQRINYWYSILKIKGLTHA